MILVVDIGNTYIHYGLCRAHHIVKTWHIACSSSLSKQTILASCETICAKKISTSLDACCIASVNPRVTAGVAALIRRLYAVTPHRVSAADDIGIHYGYQQPSALGADRIANCAGAKAYYQLPAIIIDIGTALTFDVLLRNQQHYSVGIVPGPGLAAEALAQHTALLPQIKIKQSKKLYGTNTQETINTGIFHGYAGLISSMIHKIHLGWKKQAPFTTILTGGASSLFAGACDYPVIHDQHVTLKGLLYISKITNRRFM